jgi:beta-galactosidase
MRFPSLPIFATAYYPEQWPEAEWLRDLRRMKEHGVTAVRWGEFSWSWWEIDDGAFDFAATDRFVAAVGQAGLELILCTPTATPPAWLVARHPEMLMQDQHGRPHLGNRHYGCHHHPGYLALVERIVTRLTERYRDCPHLVGWQIDNEPNMGECNAGLTYDYHPLAIAAFRRWCERRYGSITALNEAWVSHFWARGLPSFELIDPPRPGIGTVNHSAWLAWCRFRAETLADFVHWQRDLLRRLCPGVSVGTNIPDVNPTTMVKLGQDYWAQAKGLDWAGTDLYAFRKDPAWEQRFLAYETDLMRSALTHDGARFFIMETQAGPHNVPWRMDFVGGWFDEAFLERCAQTYTAGGADGVCFFLWRPWRTGVECGMNGLCDVDGTPSERARALPGIYQRARATIAARPARPRAVLHYSQASLAIAAHCDPEATPNSAIPGWHALLHEAGWRVEMDDERTLCTRAWVAGDLLVLPYSPVLSQDECAAVRRCITAGGRVVAGFASGFFDEEGRIVDARPRDLIDIFGLRQVAFDHCTAAQAWRIGALAAIGNHTRIEVQGAEVLLSADDGRPVLTSAQGGRAIFCAIDLGSLVWNRAAGVEGVLRPLLAACRS